jgi:hypothetical protein
MPYVKIGQENRWPIGSCYDNYGPRAEVGDDV